MRKAIPPKLRKFPTIKQHRLDQLLEKNSEGIIGDKEKADLARLVAEAQELMIANAKTLVRFSKKEAPRPPAGAVPVTVWIRSSAE
jgi:hypothetical protein